MRWSWPQAETSLPSSAHYPRYRRRLGALRPASTPASMPGSTGNGALVSLSTEVHRRHPKLRLPLPGVSSVQGMHPPRLSGSIAPRRTPSFSTCRLPVLSPPTHSLTACSCGRRHCYQLHRRPRRCRSNYRRMPDGTAVRATCLCSTARLDTTSRSHPYLRGTAIGACARRRIELEVSPGLAVVGELCCKGATALRAFRIPIRN
jgi:hypothetical protein